MSLESDEKAALEIALGHAVAYREDISDRPIPARIDIDEAMARFHMPLNEIGEPVSQVIDGLGKDGDDGLIQMCSQQPSQCPHANRCCT
jgi:hypothetical protein